MQSKFKSFELQTLFPGRPSEFYKVEYRLFESGKKSLTSVWTLDADKMPDLPIDIMQLGSINKDFQKALYKQIIYAMDNNAAGVMAKGEFFEKELPALKAANIFFTELQNQIGI